jgi:hypothetical protein
LEAVGVNGQIQFDGTTITILRRGFVARTTIGKGEKAIPVRSVTAVQWKPAGMGVRGFIQLTVPGGNERRSQLGRQTTDAARDENSVLFSKTQQPSFEVVRQAVQQAITQHLSGPGVPPPVPTLSVAAELAQLAELRDAGVLTEDEFAAQKAKLLGG